MKNHTVKSYDKDLHYLEQLIEKSGKLVISMFAIQKTAIIERNPKLVDKIHKIDRSVNQVDKEVEDQSIVMLATRQPLAIDLRQIIAALKISVIIERMGDLSKTIVGRSAQIVIDIPQSIITDIQKMNDDVCAMLIKVLHAYKVLDIQKALSVIEDDKLIDELYLKIIKKLSTDKKAFSNDTNSLLQLTICIKNIERLGDYVTKLAKIIYYISSGERLGTE